MKKSLLFCTLIIVLSILLTACVFAFPAIKYLPPSVRSPEQIAEPPHPCLDDVRYCPCLTMSGRGINVCITPQRMVAKVYPLLGLRGL